MKGEGWLFRGQSDHSFALLPKAGRAPFCNIDDLEFFQEWRRKAAAYLSPFPSDEWEALAIAQHHGLATRLLDWTFKYAIAAYFGARDSPKTDGALYCYYPRRFDTAASRPALNALTDVCMYSPPMSIPRLISQQGVFTCHPKPTEPLENSHRDGEVAAITIPANAKPSLIMDLDALGVNEASLFPDLDGLSRHMNWKAGHCRPTELEVSFLEKLIRIDAGKLTPNEADEIGKWISKELHRRAQRSGE